MSRGARPSAPAIRPEEPLQLLQFGLIKPYKGVDLALAALARLEPARRARLRLRILGRPHMDLDPLRRTIAEHAFEASVELRPEYVPDAERARLFAEADLLLLPYRSIDASGVAMSAVAAARPVIASALPGFVEPFGEGRGALLFPPGDAAALARILDELAARPERLDRLAAGMVELRASIPSWAEIARKTVTLYRGLLAERGRA